MKKLLFQSDDYGLTPAVSAGILHGIKEGIIKNTGLFVNMEHSKEAAQLIKDVDVCLGIDINYVAGKPISDPKLIPHLIDENGNFISSRQQLEKHKLISVNGIIFHFDEDPYPYEEVLIETENQVKRFFELTGKAPEYIHPHSLCTPNTDKAADTIAKKYKIFKTSDMMNHPDLRELPGAISLSKGITLEDQIQKDVEAELLEIALPALLENETGYYICHCGYVDYDLFLNSSLTLRRTKDLYGATSSKVKNYIKNHDIELITYRELKHLLSL